MSINGNLDGTAKDSTCSNGALGPPSKILVRVQIPILRKEGMLCFSNKFRRGRKAPQLRTTLRQLKPIPPAYKPTMKYRINKKRTISANNITKNTKIRQTMHSKRKDQKMQT